WSPSSERPSIVVTGLSPIAEMGIEQLRTAASSSRTVQAPQAATPHPYLVPTRSRWSRNTHKSGVDGSTSTSYFFLLMFKVVIAMVSFYCFFIYDRLS